MAKGCNKLTFLNKLIIRMRPLFAAIPKKDIPKAIIDIDLNVGKLSIPVKKIYENKIYSEVYKGGFEITLSHYYKVPDHPVHLNRKSVSFTATVMPDLIPTVYHMRVITKSGKIYRSAPLILSSGRKDKVKIVVYSQTKEKPVKLMVAKERVPDIKYDFTDRYGTIFHTDAGQVFYGHLGGFTDTATQIGGASGKDGLPFVRKSISYPENAKITAPVWVKEDGFMCIKFDGIGNFIAFPQDIIPRFAGYTISFEIKPTSKKEQVLFTHHGVYIGSLVVKMKDGKLFGWYEDENLRMHKFNPPLSLEIGKWSKVKIIYDLENIRLQVNDKKSKLIPCPGPGLYDVPSVFGGWGNPKKPVDCDFTGTPGWFEGYLKSFRIIHTPFYNGENF